jgi:voltage-gated potassium channel
VAPFYLPFIGVDLRVLRVMRMFRILRIAKVGRYYASLSLIKNVIRAKKEELALTLGVGAMLVVISSTILYHCENPVQPDVFSSIPATMWWAVSTLTTVGYGDMYPVTVIGKVMAGIIAITGIGMFALPTGILGAGFVDEIQRRRQREATAGDTCPYCGGQLANKRFERTAEA